MYISKYVVITGIILYCIIISTFIETVLPYGIHEWAQSDRLSLAYGFYDNGMNFFKPVTNNSLAIDRVVGVEFPFQSYLTAGIAHFISREYIPHIFRIINIVMTCIAIILLFNYLYNKTRDFLLAIIPVVFYLSSPIVVFYSFNFLPDPFALGLVTIGMIKLLKYYDNHTNKYQHYALLFFTFATLIKTSSVIFILPFYGIALISIFQQGLKNYLRDNKVMIGILTLIPFITASYILYIRYINEKYQSLIFMSSPKHFESFDELIDTFNNVKTVWLFEYFSIGMLLLLIVIFYLKIIKNKDKNEYNPILKQYSLLLITGALIFIYLFGNQFYHHDYYFIILIFSPLLFFIIIFVSTGNFKLNRVKTWSLAIALTLISGVNLHNLSNRFNEDYKPFSDWYQYKWMLDGSKKLDYLNIDRSKERFLVLGDYSPNLSLVYFDIIGYTQYEIGDDLRRDIPSLMNYYNNATVAIVNKKKYSPVELEGIDLIYEDDNIFIYQRTLNQQ